MVFFFFMQTTAYELSACLLGSEMCVRNRFINGTICDACGTALPGDFGDYDAKYDNCLRIARPWEEGRSVLAYTVAVSYIHLMLPTTHYVFISVGSHKIKKKFKFFVNLTPKIFLYFTQIYNLGLKKTTL